MEENIVCVIENRDENRIPRDHNVLAKVKHLSRVRLKRPAKETRARRRRNRCFRVVQSLTGFQGVGVDDDAAQVFELNGVLRAKLSKNANVVSYSSCLRIKRVSKCSILIPAKEYLAFRPNTFFGGRNRVYMTVFVRFVRIPIRFAVHNTRNFVFFTRSQLAARHDAVGCDGVGFVFRRTVRRLGAFDLLLDGLHFNNKLAVDFVGGNEIAAVFFFGHFDDIARVGVLRLNGAHLVAGIRLDLEHKVLVQRHNHFTRHDGLVANGHEGVHRRKRYHGLIDARRQPAIRGRSARSEKLRRALTAAFSRRALQVFFASRIAVDVVSFT